MEIKRAELEEAETQRIQNSSVHAPFNETVGRTGPDYSRLDALYQDNSCRQQRMAKLRAESVRQQFAQIDEVCRPAELPRRLWPSPTVQGRTRSRTPSPRGTPSSSPRVAPRVRSPPSSARTFTRAVQPVVEVCDDPPGRLSGLVAECAALAILERGSFCIAVAGDPVAGMLECLADDTSIDWSKWWVAFVDERCVPYGHEDSNFGASKAAWLDRVPISASQVLAVDEALMLRKSGRTAHPEDAAAIDYENQLRALPEVVLPRRTALGVGPGVLLEYPAFDLVLLAFGADGHIASLFPGHPALLDDRSGSWVRSVVDAPAGPRRRVTLTMPCVTAASRIVLAGIGRERAAVVGEAFKQQENAWLGKTSALPCSLAVGVTPGTPGPTWVLDREAAALLLQEAAPELPSKLSAPSSPSARRCSPPPPHLRSSTPPPHQTCQRDHHQPRVERDMATPFPAHRGNALPRESATPSRRRKEVACDQRPPSRSRSLSQALASRAPVKAEHDVQYIMAAVTDAIRLRCGHMHDQRTYRETIRCVTAPLQAALGIYRDAQLNSETSPGYAHMAGCCSQRLYNGGHLLPETEGWRRNLPPDPVHQVEDHMSDLLSSARAAQERLKNLVAPDRSWPQRTAILRPSGIPAASLAVDPGTKSPHAAQAKALVLFGPTESSFAPRHLTDLARLKLVFDNNDMLLAGLQQVQRTFEVVGIQDFVSAPGRLGLRYIEVLVIVHVRPNGRKSSQPFGEDIPHVCELRLEELWLHKARDAAHQHMEDFMHHCKKAHLNSAKNTDAVSYLIANVLNSCPTSRKVRGFRKLVAKRYGSAASVWRRFVGGRYVKFTRFRDICNQLGQGSQASELWEALDTTRAGCISLYDLDPEACVLLVSFRWRLLAMSNLPACGDLPHGSCGQAFAKLAWLAPPEVPGQLGFQEFRIAAKPLGLTAEETERIFAHLDFHGGTMLPARVCPADLSWLLRLPDIVDCEAVLLTSPGASEGDRLRHMSWDTRTRRQILRSSAEGSAAPPCEFLCDSRLGLMVDLQDWRHPHDEDLGSGSGPMVSEPHIVQRLQPEAMPLQEASVQSDVARRGKLPPPPGQDQVRRPVWSNIWDSAIEAPSDEVPCSLPPSPLFGTPVSLSGIGESVGSPTTSAPSGSPGEHIISTTRASATQRSSVAGRRLAASADGDAASGPIMDDGSLALSQNDTVKQWQPFSERRAPF